MWSQGREFAGQQNKSELNKSIGSQDGGPSFCTTKHIASSSNPGAQTLIEYDIDKSLEIKEEIIEDQEKCITTVISCDNNSRGKNLIENDYFETFHIKEEIIQDQENIDQELDENCESKLCTIDTREADIMNVKEPRNSKKQRIEESKSEPRKEYSCEKCARNFVHRESLNRHRKYQCGVLPQFSCEFCGKLFKLKGNMTRHIFYVHQKTDTKASQKRHNCDQCSRSYSFLSALYDHKRADHAVVIPKFICDHCGFQTKRKKYVSQHITSRHFEKTGVLSPESGSKYKCEKCGCRYFRKDHFNRHRQFECKIMI